MGVRNTQGRSGKDHIPWTTDLVSKGLEPAGHDGMSTGKPTQASAFPQHSLHFPLILPL